MKPPQIYRLLTELALKLKIKVVEKNLRNAGINVRSGLCKIKGEDIFILDKHISIYQKNRLLAICLNNIFHDDVYILPVVREYLDKHTISNL